MTANGSSGWDVPQSSLRRRRIHPEGNPNPPLNPFSKLADDLLEEILIRLPNPRPSCRCKAVCKRWRSLISDPSFNRRFIAHHQSRNQAAALLLPAEHDSLSFLPVPDEARPNFRVLDCFKDLLLCGFLSDCGELERSYLVCNPFTKQWVALPLAPQRVQGFTSSYGYAAGLVCQPRSVNYNNLVQPEAPFVYSEYRFRVVCLSQGHTRVQLLQVFCSESGVWTQIYLHESGKFPAAESVSWNGKFFWPNCEISPLGLFLVAYDPSDLNTPLKSTRLPLEWWTAIRTSHANISVSQGALHAIVLDGESLCVWRSEEADGEHWTKLYEMVVKTKTTSSLMWWGDYELNKCSVLDLHPEKPEIAYFNYSDKCVLCCNLRNGTGEPEFFSAAPPPKWYEPRWRALQPRVPCWPTLIPRYEELRGMYDGSYHCWVQNRLPSTIEECQPLVNKSRLFDEKEWDALLAAVKQCGIRDWRLIRREMWTTRSTDAIRKQWKRLVAVALGVTRGKIPNRVLEKVRIILRDFADDDEGPQIEG